MMGPPSTMKYPKYMLITETEEQGNWVDDATIIAISILR